MFEQKEKEKVVVGMDISSSIIGISILSTDLKLIDLFAVKLPQFPCTEYKDMFGKLQFFKEEFTVRITGKNYDITEFRVEANAKAFAGGATTAQTMFVLAKMNALAVYVASSLFPTARIVETQVATARKKIGFKHDRTDKKRKVKEQVFDFMTDSANTHSKVLLPVLPRKKLKSGPNKGEEVFEDCAKDMVDAYIIAIGT
jgi:hypothetical protein